MPNGARCPAGLRDQLEPEPVRFLTRGSRPAGRRPHGGRGLPPRRSRGHRVRAERDHGVNTVLQSLRFQPGDELLTNDHEYNATINAMQAVAAPDGAAGRRAPIPFPIDDRTRWSRRCWPRSPRDAPPGRQPRHQPDGVGLPDRGLVERLRRPRDRHVRRRRPCARDGPARPRRDGAAYWTGNGHKWLCAPKGSGILWVRDDRRERIQPLVISHGANEPLADRSRFRLEFDWIGTADPTPYLTLPAAIDWMAAQVPGGWPEVMASNRALALPAGTGLEAALGGAPSPRFDDRVDGHDADPGLEATMPGRACRALCVEGFEVPVRLAGPGRPRSADPAPGGLLRLSAQRYNQRRLRAAGRGGLPAVRGVRLTAE